MNARGLMELIILAIGLFTMMVMMAIATTLFATPAFELFYERHQESKRPGPQ